MFLFFLFTFLVLQGNLLNNFRLTLWGWLVVLGFTPAPVLLFLSIRIFTTSNFPTSIATSSGSLPPFRGLALALWSSKMLMKFVRSGKSQRITSSKGTILASHPVPRPPDPFSKRRSPPPPMKRRWSRFQSLSSTALVITFWVTFWGRMYVMLVVPPIENTWKLRLTFFEKLKNKISTYNWTSRKRPSKMLARGL